MLLRSRFTQDNARHTLVFGAKTCRLFPKRSRRLSRCGEKKVASNLQKLYLDVCKELSCSAPHATHLRVKKNRSRGVRGVPNNAKKVRKHRLGARSLSLCTRAHTGWLWQWGRVSFTLTPEDGFLRWMAPGIDLAARGRVFPRFFPGKNNRFWPGSGANMPQLTG